VLDQVLDGFSGRLSAGRRDCLAKHGNGLFLAFGERSQHLSRARVEVDVGHVCGRLAGKRDDLGGDELDVRKLRFGNACELVGDELELNAGQRATGERELDQRAVLERQDVLRRLTTSTASIGSTSALPGVQLRMYEAAAKHARRASAREATGP
jgi:hypothetical protein